MFDKTLIATDSSPASLAMIGCAGKLFDLGTRECVLAQCFDLREHVAFPDQIKTYLETQLDHQKKILESAGFRTSVVAEPGVPDKVLPRIATERHCSLLALGSHGSNLANDLFLGGTASEILHQAKLPVLLFRLTNDPCTGRVACLDESPSLVRHIVFATDFSEHAAWAFDYLCDLVARGACRVTLLHIQDAAKLSLHGAERLKEFDRIDRDRLNDLKKRLLALRALPVGIQIPHGSPAAMILQAVSSTKASLLVLGSRGRGYVSELFLGSVSYRIARHAPCAVLVISTRHPPVDGQRPEVKEA